MNLFSNLKGTLSSVKKDLTSSFQQKANDIAKQDEKVPGQELMTRYAEFWKELCLNSDSMGRQADLCNKHMLNLNNKIGQKKNNVIQLTTQLQTMGSVIAEVETIKTRLANISQSCEELEIMLSELSGLNMKCQHLSIMKDMEKKFSLHRIRRMKEHERNKKLLGEEHKKNLQKMKDEKKRIKYERQKVFEEVHKQEMDNYRTFGNVSSDPAHKDSPPISSDLSEITFDDENGNLELEDFLNASESEASVSDCYGDDDDDDDDDDPPTIREFLSLNETNLPSNNSATPISVQSTGT